MNKASVVISFYKNIHFLSLVLAGLETQSFKDFEVIIADDGSPSDIASKVETLLNKSSFPALHLWQPDAGFRKNKILNKALTSAASNYLIFIDGDCIPHSKFVEEHLKNSEASVALTGRRVNLSKKISEQLTPELVAKKFLENNLLKLIFDGIWGASYDVEKGFYFKSHFLRKVFNRKKRGVLGCNFSVHKSDLLGINGFDERYVAPSVGEDSDVEYRLKLNGVKIKSLNNIAVQYHLYHPLLKRTPENLKLFEKVKKEGKAFTDYGILKKPVNKE